VERSIERQKLEGQVELDWEIQVVVALLGSQTNFAEIYISNHGPGLIFVMCQLHVFFQSDLHVEVDNDYYK
jgi:hypothetical protein